MQTYVLDWLHLLLRWLHLIAGAAWIGASFYFVHLNNSVRPPKEKTDGVAGEMFAIHGGAYYQVRKLDPRMPVLPRVLHWFQWEAYTTWLTGAGLLTVVYYFQAEAYLAGDGTETGTAIGVGIGALLSAWVVYDLLCRTRLLHNPRLFGLVGLVLMTGAAWGLCEVLSPRAAYIHVGAMLGTCMAGNVLFVIIPRQTEMVTATKEGQDPDPRAGNLGALRSLHNNYMTLPVLLVMVSNHFPLLYGHTWNWALLVLVALAGAGIKHWFNLHGRGEPAPLWIWVLGAVMISVAAAVAAPPRPSGGAVAGAAAAPPFGEGRPILVARGLPCHSRWTTHPAFPQAPLGVTYDSPEEIVALTPKIKTVAVDAQTMPLGNLTEMTDEERATLGAWIDAGAPLD